MTSPSEVLWDFMTHPIMLGYEYARKYPNPGQLLMRFPNIREGLAGLTSDDVLKMRFIPWMVMDQRYEHRQRTSKLLRDFDRRLNTSGPTSYQA